MRCCATCCFCCGCLCSCNTIFVSFVLCLSNSKLLACVRWARSCCYTLLYPFPCPAPSFIILVAFQAHALCLLCLSAAYSSISVSSFTRVSQSAWKEKREKEAGKEGRNVVRRKQSKGREKGWEPRLQYQQEGRIKRKKKERECLFNPLILKTRTFHCSTQALTRSTFLRKSASVWLVISWTRASS